MAPARVIELERQVLLLQFQLSNALLKLAYRPLPQPAPANDNDRRGRA